MLRNTLTQFIIIMICLSSNSVKHALAFESKAKQAILVEHPSMQVLYKKNSDTHMVPSSMTKLLTIYIVFQQLRDGNIRLNDEFFVSKRAWSKGGSRMFLEHNAKVTVKDLLRGAIVQSGNDACIALAEGISGDVEEFVKLMNIYAKKIGMTNSIFTNPMGWPDKELKSTAHDIATLSAKLINDFPEYYHYFSESEFEYNKIRQFNRNPLLGKNGVDGLKTGQTDDGGYGVSISAKKKNRRLVLVVNGLTSKRERAFAADKLLAHGFNNFTKYKLFDKESEVIGIDTWYGSEEKISAVGEKNISVSIPKHAKYIATVRYNTPIIAPIIKGQNIANLVVSDELGNIYMETPLVAKSNVGKSNIFMRFIQNIIYTIKQKN